MQSILGSNIYYLIVFFFIYSFLGWITEIIYALKSRGVFVNRGFLFGPFCPIYGIGIILCVLLLNDLNNNLIILYISSVALITTIEYFTGYFLEKIFNTKWWDYTDDPFNLHGRVCLGYSLLWGLAVVFILKIIHPFIASLIIAIPSHSIAIISFLITMYFLVDLSYTLITLVGLNNIASNVSSFSSEIKERYSYLLRK